MMTSARPAEKITSMTFALAPAPAALITDKFRLGLVAAAETFQI